MDRKSQQMETVWQRRRSTPPGPVETMLALLAFPLGMLFPLHAFEDLDDRNPEAPDRRNS